MTYYMLTYYGTSLYTIEMVHNQDGDIYLKVYGRRIGQGMEVYAQCLLQNFFSVTEMNLGFNAVFTRD
ncbi:ZmpA/ZmpB/ZmpC family metallo-endopeptidase, partial [Streptococcus suis]